MITTKGDDGMYENFEVITTMYSNDFRKSVGEFIRKHGAHIIHIGYGQSSAFDGKQVRTVYTAFIKYYGERNDV